MTQRITLAQVMSDSSIPHNLETAKKVFAQAVKDRANWVLLSELFLTGSYNGGAFDQEETSAAFDQLKGLCRECRVTGLIGTGWRENGKTYNQIRIVDSSGALASVYAKTCLTYDDATEFQPGPLRLVHTLNDLTFGTLICNDLWVTPGFTDGPDPRMTLQLAKAGVQVIFQAVASGSEQRYRAYHESNLLLRAAEARCPIVTVNAFRAPEVNAMSGVVGTEFAYLHALPSDRQAIETVEFTPAARRPSKKPS